MTSTFAHTLGIRPVPGLILITLALTACTVGPRFVAPRAHTPARWIHADELKLPTGAAQSQLRQQGAVSEEWWRTFKDAELDSLVDRALRSNYSVKDAVLRIAVARAQRDIVAADRWPSLSGNTLFSRQRISERTAPGALFNGLGSQVGGPTFELSGLDNPFNQHQVGFDASWEIDLFGRVRRAVEAADADTVASEEDAHDVLLTLLGDIARTYIELRGQQLRLSISQRNLASQRDVLQLTRDRQQAGVGNDLDVANAAAQVSSTEALVPDLQRQIAQSTNQISLLLSLEPSVLSAELAGEGGNLPHPPLEIPVGLPGDLVRRRPDIRRAEAALHVATARVGIAEADLFPRLTLGASAGLQSQDLDNLGQWASRFASIGPRLDVPIFEGGRRRATVRLQNIRETQSALAYGNTVLAAVHEAENSLTAFVTEQGRRVSLEAAAVSSRDALRLSRMRYESGVISFLDVLDAERNLQQAELALAQSTTTVSTSLVALYKALGGGWESASQTVSQLSISRR